MSLTEISLVNKLVLKSSLFREKVVESLMSLEKLMRVDSRHISKVPKRGWLVRMTTARILGMEKDEIIVNLDLGIGFVVREETNPTMKAHKLMMPFRPCWTYQVMDTPLRPEKLPPVLEDPSSFPDREWKRCLVRQELSHFRLPSRNFFSASESKRDRCNHYFMSFTNHPSTTHWF